MRPGGHLGNRDRRRIGVGAATVRALRDCDVHVAILDLNAEKGEALAAETGAAFFPIDVTDETSVLQAFAGARAAQGQERILVHTPGGGLGFTAWRDEKRGGHVSRHDFGRFSRIVTLNLNGTFLCASVAAQGMVGLPACEDGERGVIVMMSSVASIDAPAAIAAYVAAKAGINGTTLSMARDLAVEGIRVNTILPGNFETPLLSRVADDYKTNMRNWNLMPKRFGEPSEYASLAWNTSLNFKPDPRTLIYVSAGRGFQAGGFNQQIREAAYRNYDPEKVFNI
jgi:NAD(P)-dependent dehydrogenase (short-subunit alcohol dehydrogenase family)